ncbi:hypothetical protein RhiJN_23199 [Ceratobasidium sp. AG-Ba]|nr:hypothetical protein RhiJN_23199 [Ceratobasidium sp. AG-Ba]
MVDPPSGSDAMAGQGAPRGAIDPFEEGRYRDLQATYTGGLGTIQLIRYRRSPIGKFDFNDISSACSFQRICLNPGPYDELLYVPGNMTYKTGPNSSISGLTMTRIYVSTTASIINGNTPKHLARFEFTKENESDPLSPILASVYPALPKSTSEFSPKPMFSARLAPSRRIPSCPLDLGRVPHFLFDLRLFQPPLTDLGQGNGLVGTEKWCTVAPNFSGEVRVMYTEPRLSEGKLGDGIGFPDVRPMSIGLWWPMVKILADPSVILDESGKPVADEHKKTK